MEWINDDYLAIAKGDTSLRCSEIYVYNFSGEKSLIYEENDPKSSLSVTRSRDDKYLLINSISKNSTEVNFLKV